MKEPKKIILLVVIIILTLSVAYLTYLMQDSSNPLLIFNTRASTNADDLLTDDPGDAGSDPIDEAPSPSATPKPTTSIIDELAYLSTSPTPVATGSANTTVTPTTEPTPTELPLLVSDTASTIPTQVVQLPVAGIGGQISTFIMGGVALIVVALFL
jgi:hypothetical protein